MVSHHGGSPHICPAHSQPVHGGMRVLLELSGAVGSPECTGCGCCMGRWAGFRFVASRLLVMLAVAHSAHLVAPNQTCNMCKNKRSPYVSMPEESTGADQQRKGLSSSFLHTMRNSCVAGECMGLNHVHQSSHTPRLSTGVENRRSRMSNDRRLYYAVRHRPVKEPCVESTNRSPGVHGCICSYEGQRPGYICMCTQ